MACGGVDQIGTTSPDGGLGLGGAGGSSAGSAQSGGAGSGGGTSSSSGGVAGSGGVGGSGGIGGNAGSRPNGPGGGSPCVQVFVEGHGFEASLGREVVVNAAAALPADAHIDPGPVVAPGGSFKFGYLPHHAARKRPVA